MAPYSIRYPIRNTIPKTYGMLLNDTFFIPNISNDEATEITTHTGKMRMRPTPPKRKDTAVSVTYIAQNLCNKTEFEEFYNSNLGKSVKMIFEGRTYYGYITNLVLGEFDVTFTYTYTSTIENLDIDPGFPSL